MWCSPPRHQGTKPVRFGSSESSYRVFLEVSLKNISTRFRSFGLSVTLSGALGIKLFMWWWQRQHHYVPWLQYFKMQLMQCAKGCTLLSPWLTQQARSSAGNYRPMHRFAWPNSGPDLNRSKLCTSKSLTPRKLTDFSAACQVPQATRLMCPFWIWAQEILKVISTQMEVDKSTLFFFLIFCLNDFYL